MSLVNAKLWKVGISRGLVARNSKTYKILKSSLFLSTEIPLNVPATLATTRQLDLFTAQNHGYSLPWFASVSFCGVAALTCGSLVVADCEEKAARPSLDTKDDSNDKDLRSSEVGGDAGEKSQVMASSVVQSMPALPSSSSSMSTDNKPMFSVQRQRKLNGWAAIEAKEDMKKVQLAQLLNELHKLTLESSTNNTDASETVRDSTDEATNETKGDEDNAMAERGLSFPHQEINQTNAQQLIDQIKIGRCFDKKAFIQLIRSCAETVKRDPTVLDLGHKDVVFVVGDLHGSLDNLHEVLNAVGEIHRDMAVVFNGDFVDRGEKGVEVVTTLMLLKLAYPDSVVLVRGNHEDSILTTMYGFEEEVRGKYGKDLRDLWGSLSTFFASLPLACRTNHAAIMHGGIPSEDFELEQLESITLEERSQFPSFMENEGATPNAKLVRDMLWSDPTMDNGLTPNENRGMGKHYGIDISRNFLETHGMNYLIRSHEVMDEGWDVIDCGNNRFVVTVFSTSAYPDGYGDNKGAVIRLDNSSGQIAPIHVMIEKKTEQDSSSIFSPMVKAMLPVIVEHKPQLTEAFRTIESSDGTVSVTHWIDLMKSELKMDMDWASLQNEMAPTMLEEHADGEFKSTDKIKWRDFLDQVSFQGPGKDIHDEAMESLFQNHSMLLAVFRFLDSDGNGQLDQNEFVTGITLLNERLPEERRFKDPEALFKSLDFDGSGEIDLDEFAAAFSVVSKPPDKAVLAKIFYSLDTDGSGTVDLEEFREGVAKLNQKLPQDRQVKDPDALFKNLDMDGSGEIDIEEFSAFYF